MRVRMLGQHLLAHVGFPVLVLVMKRLHYLTVRLHCFDVRGAVLLIVFALPIGPHSVPDNRDLHFVVDADLDGLSACLQGVLLLALLVILVLKVADLLLKLLQLGVHGVTGALGLLL